MTPDKEKDEAAIRKWHKEVENASNNANFDAYASHWSDDMIWMPPNMQPIHGKETCMEMFTYLTENYIVDQKVTVDEVGVSGDLAYSRFFSREKFTPKGDAPAMENDGKNIFIFKRQSDGSWLATHGIWNSNISPEASASFENPDE